MGNFEVGQLHTNDSVKILSENDKKRWEINTDSEASRLILALLQQGNFCPYGRCCLQEHRFWRSVPILSHIEGRL